MMEERQIQASVVSEVLDRSGRADVAVEKIREILCLYPVGKFVAFRPVGRLHIQPIFK